MRALSQLLTAVLLASLHGAPSLGQGAHSAQQSSAGLLFHYGLVPAEVVAAHAPSHAEREMHRGPRRGQSHLLLALFDSGSGARIAEAEVAVHITLAGGPSVTRRLEPMTIAGQPGFGGYVSVGAPGVYTLRFEARRPGAPGVASAVFEHRVAPERKR